MQHHVFAIVAHTRQSLFDIIPGVGGVHRSTRSIRAEYLQHNRLGSAV